uniref:DUF1624 domain-containing protein n=1 Tax=Macrostomum lignano TaxID=282301 RepID=A0A1I8JNW3_9PLAT
SPAEIFYFGSHYNVTAVGISLACIVSATTFVPLFYELEITSIYETLYLAVAQLAPAIALDAGRFRLRGSIGGAVHQLDWDRFDSLNWSPDPRTRLTVWSGTIGVMFGWIPWYGPNQAAFQRFASLPSLTKAK